MAKTSNFESKLEELNEIIQFLDSDDIDLKTSVAQYKKGVKLIKECENELNKVKKDLKVIQEEDRYA